ncbi:alpha/beta hydrolase [Actinocorallia longicatena]|uniref:Alpha/beta hydrolase n=2 Tax=Actinocorallia longicatena TaxID=111803 RepID=A0ABP6Q4K1_9ACTN
MEIERRVEPGTRLDLLARWDVSSVATLRSSLAAVSPPPVRADPRVRRSDALIPGIDGRPDVRVRWYRPAGLEGPLPCLVYLHGGAYIMGTLEENDARLDRMAAELGCAAVSVDWRLAPEHPYPAGLDDAETVWRRLTADPVAHGIDPARVAVGGASAGAGLAAALCLRLRDLGLTQPVLQLLVYPMLDDREETPSMLALRAGAGHWGLWPIEAQRLAWGAYLGALPDGPVPPTAAPARATDLSGLAPAFLGVGDLDAYLDEDLAYASRLSAAGVPTEVHVYPGVIHGGFLAHPRTPRTIRFLADALQALSEAFAPAATYDDHL